MRTIKGTYSELLQREEWKAKRRQIIKRDESACRNCGSTRFLQVHHRRYHRSKETGNKVAPWCYADRHLITLCQTCHKRGHDLYQIPHYTI